MKKVSNKERSNSFESDNGYTIDYELSKLLSANDRVNTNKDIIYYITSP